MSAFKKTAYSQTLTTNPFPMVKGCVCLVGFASLQSPWAYTPGIHAGGYGDWRPCDPPWGYAQSKDALFACQKL